MALSELTELTELTHVASVVAERLSGLNCNPLSGWGMYSCLGNIYLSGGWIWIGYTPLVLSYSLSGAQSTERCCSGMAHRAQSWCWCTGTPKGVHQSTELVLCTNRAQGWC